MLKTRLTIALAAGLGILAAAPQAVTDGLGVTVDVGSSALMHRNSVVYPDAARRARVEGTVLVEAVIDGSGDVVDANVLSGPNELRRAAVQSVLGWHFANDTGATTRQVKITFKLPAETPGEIRPAGVLPAPLIGKTLKSIRTMGLSDDVKDRLMSRLSVHEGDNLSADSFGRLVIAVREFDEHLNVSVMPMDKEGGMALVIVPMGANIAQQAVPGRIKVGANVQGASLTSQVQPVYPPLAKQARIEGTVKLAVVIGRDGSVVDLTMMEGPAALMAAAMDAVKQWKYRPTLLNGNPVEVSTQVDVNFTLAQK